MLFSTSPNPDEATPGQMRHKSTNGAASRQVPSLEVPSHQGPSRQQTSLRERIHQRIQTRLHERVRDLEVEVADDLVILRGRCSTYYSKQLAQHVALGAMEDENLENAIEVLV